MVDVNAIRAGLAWVAVRSFAQTLFVLTLIGLVLAGLSYYLLRSESMYGAIATLLAVVESFAAGVLGGKREEGFGADPLDAEVKDAARFWEELGGSGRGLLGGTRAGHRMNYWKKNNLINSIYQGQSCEVFSSQHYIPRDIGNYLSKMHTFPFPALP